MSGLVGDACRRPLFPRCASTGRLHGYQFRSSVRGHFEQPGSAGPGVFIVLLPGTSGEAEDQQRIAHQGRWRNGAAATPLTELLCCGTTSPP